LTDLPRSGLLCAPMPERAPPGIAIVGMAARFAGAPDLDTYRRNLENGVDAISSVPASRWDPVYYDPASSAPDRLYARRGGFLAEGSRKREAPPAGQPHPGARRGGAGGPSSALLPRRRSWSPYTARTFGLAPVSNRPAGALSTPPRTRGRSAPMWDRAPVRAAAGPPLLGGGRGSCGSSPGP
jgi:Beta-ketoacyl synthase, N-terminal domain